MKRSRKITRICIVLVICSLLNSIMSAREDDGAPAATNRQILARQARFRELLQSVQSRDGEGEEPGETVPAIVHWTRDGYLRFLAMPRSSHIEAAKAQDWTPEDVAGTFLREWKDLFTSDTAAVDFRQKTSLHRQDYSVVQFGQAQIGFVFSNRALSKTPV